MVFPPVRYDILTPKIQINAEINLGLADDNIWKLVFDAFNKKQIYESVREIFGSKHQDVGLLREIAGMGKSALYALQKSTLWGGRLEYASQWLRSLIRIALAGAC